MFYNSNFKKHTIQQNKIPNITSSCPPSIIATVLKYITGLLEQNTRIGNKCNNRNIQNTQFSSIITNSHNPRQNYTKKQKNGVYNFSSHQHNLKRLVDRSKLGDHILSTHDRHQCDPMILNKKVMSKPSVELDMA